MEKKKRINNDIPKNPINRVNRDIINVDMSRIAHPYLLKIKANRAIQGKIYKQYKIIAEAVIHLANKELNINVNPNTGKKEK